MNLPPGRWDSRDEWLFACCPFCGEEFVFSYNVEKKVGKCWRPSCKRRIAGDKYLERLEGASNAAWSYRPPPRSRSTAMPVVGLLQVEQSRSAKEFLLGRAITPTRAYDLGILTDTQRLLCPIHPISEGMPSSYIYRDLRRPAESFWKFASGTCSSYYVWDPPSRDNDQALVTEGVFDIFSTGMEDYGVALFGSEFNQEKFLYLRRRYRRITVWFDPDPAGQKATAKAVELGSFYNYPVDVVDSSRRPKDYKHYSGHPLLLKLRKDLQSEPSSPTRRYTFSRG